MCNAGSEISIRALAGEENEPETKEDPPRYAANQRQLTKWKNWTMKKDTKFAELKLNGADNLGG